LLKRLPRASVGIIDVRLSHITACKAAMAVAFRRAIPLLPRMAMLSSLALEPAVHPRPRTRIVQGRHGQAAKPSPGLPAVPYHADPLAPAERRPWCSGPPAPVAFSRFDASMDQRTIASLFDSAERGDAAASEALFAALYSELHRLARRELARRGGNLTLGVTTLLHEAYIKMADRDGVAFPDRARFMSYAARVMRGLIIDYVRRRRAHKRGGLFEISALETTIADRAGNEHDLQRISDALDELATVDATLAEVVDLKFFCGFSLAEIGAMRGVSERTVQRQWEKARLYLHRAIGDEVALPDERSTV
jgi:RNA polymerase sigma factor (TIGR02999 family)